MPQFSDVYAIAVEDDEGGALLMTAILRRLGIDITLHATGENFLEFAKSLPNIPNIIFLDINLPRNNGLDIARSLRADEQFADVYLVAVTALNPIDIIPKAKEAGFNGYISKPINRDRFPKQIERILNGEAVWEMR